MKTTTAMRLTQIMNQRNLRQTDVLELCKPYCEQYGVQIRRSDLSQYVSGKVNPNQYRLTILAHALNVTEPYLMGYDDKPTTSRSQLEERYNQLTLEQQQAVDILIDTYLVQNKKAAFSEKTAM